MSQETLVSRTTCRRWWQRFKEQFLLHADALSTYFCEMELAAKKGLQHLPDDLVQQAIKELKG